MMNGMQNQMNMNPNFNNMSPGLQNPVNYGMQ